MDPKDFGISTLPLQHEPYGPILPERLAGANKGKVAVVTGAGRGNLSQPPNPERLVFCHLKVTMLQRKSNR